MKYILNAALALWLGLTIYLMLIAEPRDIGWYIVAPISFAVIFFLVQSLRVSREARRTSRPQQEH